MLLRCHVLMGAIMRERLDCVILEFGGMTDWCELQEGIYARGRLHLHRLEQAAPYDGDVHALLAAATTLQRFDVCLLAVGERNLAWVRQLLQVAQGQLQTPLVGIVHDLTAPAIDDLYNLGMVDFVRQPLCVEEIRVRTERLLNSLRGRPVVISHDKTAGLHAVYETSKSYGQTATARFGDIPYRSADHRGAESGNPAAVQIALESGDRELEAFAIASASRCATSDDSFGAAKSRVIQCFERAYLRASLAKSSGNIAMAARGAKKHRRAYWALMRKHDIDATPFRKGPSD